jgi:hypothetical protein
MHDETEEGQEVSFYVAFLSTTKFNAVDFFTPVTTRFFT